jgi:Domain of unknown function (DUF4390)
MHFVIHPPCPGLLRRLLRGGGVVSALLLALLLALCLPLRAHAEGVEITRASLENSDDGYKLAVSFSFELNRGLEDAITRGIPLYFTTDVDLTRPRWYWFDEKTISSSQTTRISYNALTRQYQAAIGGRLQASFATLDEALSLVRRPGRWVIAEKGVLKPGETYSLTVRMGLDVALMPKPFQINALNNSDWRLTSERKQFLFKAE